MENDDLVTIFTVQSPAEAEIIRSSLESVGISCTIGGEGQAGFAGVLSIDILTSVDDADRARKHLRLLEREKIQRRRDLRERKKAREAGNENTSPPDLEPPENPSTDIQSFE